MSWEVNNATAAYQTATDGIQTIRWPAELGSPTVTGAEVLEKTGGSKQTLLKLESKGGRKVQIERKK